MISGFSVDDDIIEVLKVLSLEFFREPLQGASPWLVAFTPIGNKARVVLCKRKIKLSAFINLSVRKKLKKRSAIDIVAILDKVQP